MMAIHGIRDWAFVVLEGLIPGLYLALRFMDLSRLGIWQYWLGMMFFWMLVLLLVASFKLFSRNRSLSLTGFAIVGCVVASVVFASMAGAH